MREFKDIILELRLERDFNQAELAKALNVSKSSVGMWETGKRLPGPEKYEEIADYFNVDMDYLYGRTNIRKRVHYDKDGNEYLYNSPACDMVIKLAEEISNNEILLEIVDIGKDMTEDRLGLIYEMMNAMRNSDKS